MYLYNDNFIGTSFKISKKFKCVSEKKILTVEDLRRKF